MDGIRQYILSVTAAALICSIVKTLAGKKSGNGVVVNLMCGAFLAVTLLSPWLDWDIQDITLYSNEVRLDASDISSQAQQKTQAEIRAIIKERAETYILDKASSMKMDITAEILLADDTSIPTGVVITGNASPYNKIALSQYIEDTLAITEDNQIWNSKE